MTRAAITDRDLKIGGYKKPMSRFDPWVSPLASDNAHKLDMEMGSAVLLKRLWASHPRILQYQADCGRTVVRL